MIDELEKAQEQIGRLTFDIGCMKTEKEIADIRLNGFEKWLEDQAQASNILSNEYAEALDVFKKMVRNEFK